MPEPVAPTKMTMPRLSSPRPSCTCGRFQCRIDGRDRGGGSCASPARRCCCCMNSVDAKAADALRRDREVALLGGFSNSSAACLSFITECEVAASAGRQRILRFDTGLVILPSTLNRRREMPAVMNRSDASCVTPSARSNVGDEFRCLIAIHVKLPCLASRSRLSAARSRRFGRHPLYLKLSLVNFALARLGYGDHVALDEFRRGSGRASCMPIAGRSGSTSTSARSWPRGSGCGSPGCRS